MKILVISEIHGNASALRAVAKRERDVDETIFLGDAILSGPQSNAVMELLSELQPAVSLMGNHDVEVLDPALFSGWHPEWISTAPSAPRRYRRGERPPFRLPQLTQEDGFCGRRSYGGPRYGSMARTLANPSPIRTYVILKQASRRK